jgi:tRNA(Ile)-lysidine synthase TilS/MesJ
LIKFLRQLRNISKENVRHVLGVSGGKDSAALAIYLKDNYLEISDKMEYFFSYL